MTGVYTSADFTRHLTGAGHPERPERIKVLLPCIERAARNFSLQMMSFQPAEEGWIAAVHPPEHIASIKKACKTGMRHLDSDTAICEVSFEIALQAVGAAVAASKAVISGELDNAFCAIRPPGHHAEPSLAMGFCLFNNIAVAASWLLKQSAVGRVCILDWDVHHGNGTQSAFYNNADVLYISLHQHPLYPGTGGSEERGVGTTLNLPLPAGCQDEDYMAVFAAKVVPAIREFAPDFMLISAGFDAHHLDPLANMNVTEKGYADMTEVVCDLAAEFCDGRVVSLLEGGYHLDALCSSVTAHLEVLSGRRV